MKNKKDLFRWIILLPASLISGFLAKLLTHIILYLSLINGRIISGVSPEFVDKIEYYIFPFVFWITSVLVAYEIAPKYKVRASMILIIAYFASLIILKVDTLSSLDQFEWHMHEKMNEVMIVLKGQGIVKDEDGIYTYSAGDVFVFPQGVFHEIENPSNEEHEYIFVRVYE